jgi:hypothetical protein
LTNSPKKKITQRKTIARRFSWKKTMKSCWRLWILLGRLDFVYDGLFFFFFLLRLIVFFLFF